MLNCVTIPDSVGVRIQYFSHVRSLQDGPQIRMWVSLKITLIFQSDNSSHIIDRACHNSKANCYSACFWRSGRILSASQNILEGSKAMKMFPYSTFLLCQEQNVVTIIILLEHNTLYLVSALECTMHTNDLLTLVPSNTPRSARECEIFPNSRLNCTMFINFSLERTFQT